MWAKRINYYIYNSDDQWIGKAKQQREALGQAQRSGVGSYFVRRVKRYDSDGILKYLRQDNNARFIRTCLQCTCTVRKGGHSQCETMALLEGKTIWGQRSAPKKVGKKKIYKA